MNILLAIHTKNGGYYEVETEHTITQEAVLYALQYVLEEYGISVDRVRHIAVITESVVRESVGV